jgi:hypothetical protein
MWLFLGLLIILALILTNKSSTAPKQYGIKSTTSNGETVKSHAEKTIADYFTRKGINYQYEPGIRGIYADPDFYLPDYNVYVEYWGLLDADDPHTRNKYEKSMKRKMAIYHKNKIKFISIYPRNLRNLDWIFRKKLQTATGRQLN